MLVYPWWIVAWWCQICLEFVNDIATPIFQMRVIAEVGNIQFLCLRASFQVLRWHPRLSRSAPATGSPRKPVTVTARIIAFLVPLATGILEKWGWCWKNGLFTWCENFVRVKEEFMKLVSSTSSLEQETFEQSDVHFNIRSCRFSMFFLETANK